MVTYIRSDLEFILAQIKIAEQHADGTPLFGPGGLVPTYNISAGLRTVDGSFNHLLPGQEQWGASGVQFPSLLAPQYRPADGTPFDPDGPGPAPAIPTAPNYNPSNNPNSLVFDSSLRTISNLIVDQSLANPAAIQEGLERGGVSTPTLANIAAVTAIYQTFKPASDAEYQARVVYEAARVAANALDDGDPLTPPAPAEATAIAARDVAQAAHQVTVASLEAARAVRDVALVPYGITMDGDNVNMPNTAPDGGLSAPFNSWFTLFGQFFDHGLDLVNKGGSGTVFVPLQPDDPLYVAGSPTNFMVLTRATVSAGADGIMGTSDDVRPVNTTTAYVDQNQTYASHASHQVFLRQYEVNGAGQPVATGRLIEGSNGGMANWGELKVQAKMLGILLTDQDVGKVPLLRTDQYGNFIPNASGYAQVITGVGADGIPNTADDIVISGTPAAPVSLATAIRTNSAFLADIAHNAVPNGIEDGDITIGLANPGNNPLVYDNELLDAHFIAGDGRVNENVGLTAVHHVFHSEHNRLVEHTKSVVLADAAALLAGGATEAAAVAFLNEWLVNDVAAVPVGPGGLVWDGERLFQAAKFGTEMQYQHLVFEEFARKIQPQIDFFIVPDGFDTTINPDIVAEFAHVVYRFGHSMLTETIDRFDSNFTPNNIGLIEGFLNPLAFNSANDPVAAGDIIRGMTRQVGNEIDEFVTSAVRNNLLGLPLDLATINLARGRDAGVPSLNAARTEFYEATQHDARLRPYHSWVDFAGNLKNEASIINFIASYGTHASITSETTLQGKRDAAMAIVFAGPDTPPDAEAFLNGTGAYASNLGGLNNVDLWIGGLAEKILPFGGMLGSTFNFVFEVQMENLQNADRFYYLQRLDGLHLFGEMEGNSFASLIMRNTTATHLPSDVFSTPGLILEVDRTKQYNPGIGESAGADGILFDNPLTVVDESADNLGLDPAGGSILTPLVIRNNPATVGPDTNYLRYTGGEHVVLGGTEGNDILIASEGDDAIYGDGGNDNIEGGAGNDIINGGAGDDIIRDLGGDDNFKGGDGNDAIHTGPGLDLVLAGRGQDFVVLGSDALSEVFAGEGNDFVLGNAGAERILGNEGDDWLEHGAFTGMPGDNLDEIFARDPIDGNDVFLGLGGFDEFIGEGGDDIMVGSLGAGKMSGMSGFDWAVYKDFNFGANVDLFRLHIDQQPIPPQNAALDTYDAVEGLSGSRFNDTMLGSNDTAAQIGQTLAAGGTHGYLGSLLDAKGIALIAGLQDVVGAGVTSFDAGEIILGGGGSDIMMGRGGNDIIDGDKWLDVQIGVFAAGDTAHTGTPIALHNSMTTLVSSVFSGQINPGQLAIVRTIRTDTTPGDVDTAVFSGARAEYTFGLDALGRLTVAHTGGTQADGTDTITRVELLQFTDQIVDLRVTAPSDIQWNGVTPGNGTALLGNTANGLPGAGTVIANLSSTDADTTSGFVYALAAGSSPGFTVGAAGVVTRTGSAMASGTTYTVNVTSTDTTGGVRTESFNIQTGTNSVLLGAAGTDTLTATTLDSVLYGSGGDDVLNGSGANNNMFGQQGNDLLNGLGGNDILAGGSGNDTVLGGAGNDTIRHTVGDGAGVIDGGAGTDTLVIGSSPGANSLTVSFDGTAITVVEGGTVAGIEAVTLDLGGGIDTLVYVAAGGVLVNLATGTASGFAAIANVENVTGNGGADTLTGNAQANTLTGGGGADILDGGAGGDVLIGGAGADTINTGALNDNVQDIVRFVAAADFGDTVLNFDANGADGVDDRIEFGAALSTAWDDGRANGNFLFASGNNGAGTVNAHVGQNNADIEALFLSGNIVGEGVTTANLGNAAAVSAAFNAEFVITAANGEDALLVINDTDANSFSLWQWIQAGGGETSSGELTLIAIVTANATVTTGNFDFI